MLTILICPPGGRGSAQLMERLRPWADRGERALLLVPESDSHAAERELLAACGSRAGEYAGVTTFSKLTEDVLERTGALPETLDDGGRVLTMHRALTAARPGLTYYRKAGRPQLTARLVELAGELQSCAVTPEMLLRAEEAGPKIRDLGLICAGRGGWTPPSASTWPGSGWKPADWCRGLMCSSGALRASPLKSGPW